MFVLGLHCEGCEEDVKRDEEEIPVGVEWILTLGVGSSIRIDGSVDCSSDGNAITEEKGVYDGKDESDGSRNNGTRLQFKCRAEYELAGQFVSWWIMSKREVNIPSQEES